MPNGNTPAVPLSTGNTPLSLSPKGLVFIERHEGFMATVYNDAAGNATIGYGHLIKPGEDFSNGITPEQASQLLSQDSHFAADAVNRQVRVSLTQTQFDALVDFTFNLGSGNLAKSTLLRNINSGKPVDIRNFTDWHLAGGKVIPGLVKRRTDEFNLFSKGEYGW